MPPGPITDHIWPVLGFCCQKHASRIKVKSHELFGDQVVIITESGYLYKGSLFNVVLQYRSDCIAVTKEMQEHYKQLVNNS